MSEDTLRDLEEHLGAVEINDPAARTHAKEIREQVQRAIDDTDERPTLIERLNEALVLFRNDHPDTADAIRRAINILSAGGV